MAIFPWAAREHSHVIFDRQMRISRSAVNAAAFVAFFMFGNCSRKISAATQYFGQEACGTDVHHNKNRSIEVLRQMFVERTKSLHSAGRSADNDNIAFGHGQKRPPSCTES